MPEKAISLPVNQHELTMMTKNINDIHKKTLFGAVLKFGGNLDFLDFRREIFYNVELRTQSFQELSDVKGSNSSLGRVVMIFRKGTLKLNPIKLNEQWVK